MKRQTEKDRETETDWETQREREMSSVNDQLTERDDVDEVSEILHSCHWKTVNWETADLFHLGLTSFTRLWLLLHG